MSTQHNNGSHQRAAELHDLAAHAHRTAALHGQQDHLSSHELSRQALEQSHAAHAHTKALLEAAQNVKAAAAGA